MTLQVNWRSGKQSVVKGVKANRICEIDEAEAVAQAVAEAAPARGAVADSSIPALEGPANPPAGKPALPTKPLFEDVSDLLRHSHIDEPFDDFVRQPLLPRKLSQLGPALAWFDLNGDGWDDLIIGSGRGGQLGVYLNDTKGHFKLLTDPPINQRLDRDQTSILGWQKAPGQTVLLAGTSQYENTASGGPWVRQYHLAVPTVDESLSGDQSSAGPLILGDIDGDGDLDLFVGGRVLPGRYPEPASSRMYRNADGKFRLDEANNRLFDKIGLVSGAVFSDLDSDGYPELILACDWGPIRVFRNELGIFQSWDAPVTFAKGPSAPDPQASTLSQLTGWWNGVTTGDFDGDGQLDILATNWGRNTKYRSHLQRPIQVFYGDFAGLGRVDLIEAYYDKTLNKVVPWVALDVIAPSLPLLNEKFSTFRAYSAASVAEMIGDKLIAARTWRAVTLDSMVLMNRRGRFEAGSLPVEAQFAPAFGACVGDFDGDGNEDVFLSQNFFSVEPETSRFDGGRGLWLRGQGNGEMKPVPGQESGVKVYGQQRGCALADFDDDGRVDLVVGQNRGPTMLLRNLGARPGLLVRLEGGAGNPVGAGAAIRLKFGDRMGPVREVRAGGGYWSQDSAIQVMSAPEEPSHVWIRWPGGKTTVSEIPAGAKRIKVSADGKVILERKSK